VPVGETEAGVRKAERIAGRDDVEYRQPLDALGMIESQPVRAPGAAVVAADEKAAEAEVPHQGDLVAGHRPLRVRLVVGRRCGRRALSVAAGRAPRP
jgi:hypothetical protein